MNIDLRQVLIILAAFAGVGLILVALLLAWVFTRVRRITLPANAQFFEALRYTPISVVLLLDALDFALDILSTPVSWFILGRLGLAPLRGVTIIKDLIPFTQWFPAMTIAWALARLFPTL